MSIRSARHEDISALFEMNQREVPHVGDVDAARFERLTTKAVYMPVFEVDFAPAGFLILMDQDADYDSPNFIWFRDRYERFLYVDRVVIGPNHKRRGLGKSLYEHCIAYAAGHGHNLIALEVNIAPPNPDSMAFHKFLGFREVGLRKNDDSSKAVSMQIKQL